MKLSVLKQHIAEIERDIFAYQKMNIPMGRCPEDPDVFVKIGEEEEEPLLFFESHQNKIYL